MSEAEIMEMEIAEYMGESAIPEFDTKDKRRGIRRRKNLVHALRKRAKDRAKQDPQSEDRYDNLHEYSKGKIHCSCPSCKVRTNNKNSVINKPPARDKRKNVRLDFEVLSYESI